MILVLITVVIENKFLCNSNIVFSLTSVKAILKNYWWIIQKVSMILVVINATIYKVQVIILMQITQLLIPVSESVLHCFSSVTQEYPLLFAFHLLELIILFFLISIKDLTFLIEKVIIINLISSCI